MYRKGQKTISQVYQEVRWAQLNSGVEERKHESAQRQERAHAAELVTVLWLCPHTSAACCSTLVYLWVFAVQAGTMGTHGFCGQIGGLRLQRLKHANHCCRLPCCLRATLTCWMSSLTSCRTTRSPRADRCVHCCTGTYTTLQCLLCLPWFHTMLCAAASK